MTYRNGKRDIALPIMLAAVLVVGLLLGLKLGQRGERPSLTVYPKTDKLGNILNYISEEYVDSISINTLVENTIPAMLKNLDPHSVYIPAKDFEAVNAQLVGEFDGIGIQFNMNSDTATVITVIPNGPSERAGLLAGDRIVAVDGRNIAGVKFPFDSIPRLLKGPHGTHVQVLVMRPYEPAPISFDLVRDHIPIYSVDVSFMLSASTGYLKISSFAQNTHKEFMEATAKLRQQGMSRLIIDLRGNSGGYMEAATRIANELLPVNRLIVYTQGKNRPRRDMFSNGHGHLRDVEVAVLIDEFSASASEILAGALQDNDRGSIIGRRSFGKGLVQEQIFFSDGSALRLVIARYYTPSGRCIQKPYTLGDDNDDYFYDISRRYMHGEFSEQDSIHLADTMRYQTVGGRTVYGGGGIMPDIFVPLDTTGITPYYRRVSRKNLVYRYAFKFVEEHRRATRTLKTFDEVDAFLRQFDLLGEFVAYASTNDVPPNAQQIATSQAILQAQLRAVIARNIIDNEGFYPYIKDIDETLQRALAELEGDTVKR
ncbi:MAG: PDZ domain-containing protein [Bacteroidales bacterium]|nr:PDZ domain-containing protein [Bacteroidales bacterium]